MIVEVNGLGQYDLNGVDLAVKLHNISDQIKLFLLLVSEFSSTRELISQLSMKH